MPDPFLGDEQLVGEWDAETRLLIVTGWVAGPAGSAGVELPGAELDIDVAAPARTCQLLVPAASTGNPAIVPEATRAVLHRLLGDPRAVALLNLTRGHSGRPVVLPPAHGPGVASGRPGPAGDHAPPGNRPEPRRDQFGRGVALGLARLGLAQLATTDDHIAPAARATARLEAAVAAADLPADLGLAPAVAAEARAGTEALLGLVAAGALGWLDPISAFRLAGLVRRVANLPGTDPATAEALGRLAAGLDLDPSADAPTPAPSPAPAAGAGPAREGIGLMATAGSAASAGAALRRVVDDEVPRKLPAPELDAASAHRVLPHGARPTIARPSTHEIEVSLPRLADAVNGVWARVLRRADGLLLALAPFRAAGPGRADARARLLVPDEASDGLLVDLTVDPGSPAPSADLLGFGAALAAGRRAARAQRLGQRGTAIAGWRECAQAWSAVGDDRRAAMAAEYAELVLVQAVPPTTEPLVSDRLT
jgi:hypothetical protein